MEIRIRDAVPEDAPFLAWVMQAAARSHRPLSFWDLAFPGPDRPRLEYIAELAVSDAHSFTHYSGFLVAEADGHPVAGLSAYDSTHKNMDAFLTSIAGIVGYFGLIPGSEVFTRYGRAAGVFEVL